MIHNEEHEPITVYMDYKPEKHVRPFYCVKCGKCVAEITGEPRVIIPGYPNQEELDRIEAKYISKCSGVIFMGNNTRIKCTAKYIFN